MAIGDIRYTDSDEALQQVTEEEDDFGRHVWRAVVNGDFRVIAEDQLTEVPKIPTDALVIVDNKGTVWTQYTKSEQMLELAERWDKSYPKAAPHKVAVFSFKEWV